MLGSALGYSIYSGLGVTLKQVLVLGFGDSQRSASTIYRIVQYESIFNAHGARLSYLSKLDFNWRWLAAVRKADVVINQKCIFGVGVQIPVRALAKRLVFDIDDSMWARPVKPYHPLKRWQIEARLARWVKSSDVVTVANSYIGDQLGRRGGEYDIVPMSLDLETWRPCQSPQRPDSGTVRMGWAGSPVGFAYLESIAPALKEALARNPMLRLAIYSGKRPNLDLPFEYVEFKRGTEHEFVQGLDIGLLPLGDDESARGKSPMKAIQYLACGVPVVGAAPGATRDILNAGNSVIVSSEQEWIHALGRLANSAPLRKELGAAGLADARAKFDRTAVGERFVRLVLGLPAD